MTAKKPNQNPSRQQEWRARIPQLQELVEETAPRLYDKAHEARFDQVPEEWRVLVDAMAADVRAKASARDWQRDLSDTARLGYEWSWKVSSVSDMIDYLMRAVRDDLGFKASETLASMLLVSKAFLQLSLELQDGGTAEGREDAEENRYRVLHAMKALTERFDDVGLRRFRALQVAEVNARRTHIPTDADVEARVECLRKLEPALDDDAHRSSIAIDQPVASALLSRQMLAEVDERFHALDPLVILEEFAEADGARSGGRSSGGDGRLGPARALARLAIMCGALDFEQREGESFDDAVERARQVLLTNRSRLRKEIRGFPGEVSDADDAID